MMRRRIKQAGPTEMGDEKTCRAVQSGVPSAKAQSNDTARFALRPTERRQLPCVAARSSTIQYVL